MNLRQLRESRRLKSLLNEGHTIALRERNKTIARIVPDGVSTPPSELPDFEARSIDIFGNRSVSGSAIVSQERGRF